LNKICENATTNIADIVEAPKVLGVHSFGDIGATVRIFAKTFPGKQWDVERAIRKQVYNTFIAEGIKIARKSS